MRPKLWTLSGLEAELGRDRRTIARALRSVRPDGQVRGHDGWHMTTALSALSRYGLNHGSAYASAAARAPAVSSAAAVSVPLGYEAVERISAVSDKCIVFGLLSLAYRMPRLAASIAAGAEVPMKSCYALYEALMLGMFTEVADACAALEIEPFLDPETADIMAPDAFQPCNWEQLARNCGEPVDLDAWKAWSRHCYGPGSYERHEAKKAARARASGPAACDPSV